MDKQKEGEILRLLIRGSGKTVEEAAALVGKTRRMLYNYFKDDILEADFKKIIKEKLGFDISQNVPRITSNDTLKNNDEASITEIPNNNIGTLHNLSESNRMLAQAQLNFSLSQKDFAESNKQIAQSNAELVQMVKSATANATPNNILEEHSKLSDVLELIIEVGLGKRWDNPEAAAVELNKRFFGSKGAGHKKGIHAGAGK